LYFPACYAQHVLSAICFTPLVGAGLEGNRLEIIKPAGGVDFLAGLQFFIRLDTNHEMLAQIIVQVGLQKLSP